MFDELGQRTFGEWKELGDYLRYTPKAFNRRAFSSGVKIAKELIARVREYIATNEGGYDLKDPKEDNRGTPPLVKTGAYAGLANFIGNSYKGEGSFGYTVLDKSSGGDWKIEVRPDDMPHVSYKGSGEVKESGLTNYQLGKILESRMPHWSPVLNDFDEKWVGAMWGEMKFVFGNKKGQHLARSFSDWGSEE